MNAKELRQAAEYTVTMWDNHDSKRLVAGDELFFNSDGEPDAVTFARHILSTVRDDDDEPFDIKNARNLVGNSVELQPGHLYLTIIVDDDNSIDSSTVCHEPRTMGQFRSLCKGLGIVLEETE